IPRSDASLRWDCAPSRSTDSKRPSTIRAFSDSSLRAACGIPRPLGVQHYLVHSLNVKPDVQALNTGKLLLLKGVLLTMGETGCVPPTHKSRAPPQYEFAE